MFTYAQLEQFVNDGRENSLTATPDIKYGLYKFDRGDKIEIRMVEQFFREKQHTIGYMDTILRFYIKKEDDLVDTLYRLLRNCLLVERIK